MKCERFCNYHCTTNDCPNIQADIATERYGDGIAEDMGLYRVKCKDCIYNDKRCDCEDCWFEGGEECPETEKGNVKMDCKDKEAHYENVN